MIFSIRGLGFELGSLLLEGWAAFAARVVCAALLLVLGWLVRQLLSRKVCPALLRRSWRLAGTPILLRSFAVPVQRLTLAAFIYAAAASLPWAIAGVSKFLLTVFELAATFFVCQGLYAAADLTDLLLANCGEEVRANRTLTTLLNKVYKVLIVVLGIMTMAQETGLPVGSIVASAGLVGLTISLAAQDSAKNLFSGLVILLDRPFSIGDWITVGDVSGEVVDINFRSTKVRALDNSVYILTNSTVSSATINNGTLRNKRLYRFTLGVTYDTTRPQLEQLMADLTAMPLHLRGLSAGQAERLRGFQHRPAGVCLSAHRRHDPLFADAERFESRPDGRDAEKRRGLRLPLHHRVSGKEQRKLKDDPEWSPPALWPSSAEVYLYFTFAAACGLRQTHFHGSNQKAPVLL